MFQSNSTGPLLNKPPPLQNIKVIKSANQFGGTGFSQLLDSFSDQQLLVCLVSKENCSVIKGTPVEDVLNKLEPEHQKKIQIIVELRSNAKKLTPAWRWKAIKQLPVNLDNKAEFLSNYKVEQSTLRRLISIIFTTVFPHDLLGDDNDQIMIDFLLKYLYSKEDERAKLEYPRMYIKHSTPLRAMRSPQFRESLEKCYNPLVIMQKSTLIHICNFVTRVTISLMLQFVYISCAKYSYPVFYSKRAFNYWRKKEMRQFKEDYGLEKAPLNKGETPNHLISNTRIVAKGASMRPICPFKKAADWGYSNELQIMNHALDFYLRSEKNEGITGIHSAIRSLKQYLSHFRLNHPDKKLYFIKADVSKCFASMKHDILGGLLETLVGGRTSVVAYAVGTDISKRCYRIFGTGRNQQEALTNLEKIKQRKKIQQYTGDVQIKTYTADIVENIMGKIEQLRFSLSGDTKDLYRMGKGVPQGCILSSRLSHIYLLDYDKSVLKPLLTPKSKLFRYADDYLIVLDDKQKAIDILDHLQCPRNAYSLHFRQEKMQVSFNGAGYKKNGNIINWCGAQIDAKRKMVLPKRTIVAPMNYRSTRKPQRRSMESISVADIIQQRRKWKIYEMNAKYKR